MIPETAGLYSPGPIGLLVYEPDPNRFESDPKFP